MWWSTATATTQAVWHYNISPPRRYKLCVLLLKNEANSQWIIHSNDTSVVLAAASLQSSDQPQVASITVFYYPPRTEASQCCFWW